MPTILIDIPLDSYLKIDDMVSEIEERYKHIIKRVNVSSRDFKTLIKP